MIGLNWKFDAQLKDNPHPPFLLSQNFNDISMFWGLSMETYHKGFQTRRDVFQWATSCKYFNHSQFQTRGEGIKKVKQDRRMYAEFIEWVEESRPQLAESCLILNPHRPRGERVAKAREDALLFFDKRDAFDTIVRDRTNKQRLKEFFNGRLVREWAELNDNDWASVKMIIAEVRRRLGGDYGIMDVLDGDGEDRLEDLVHQIKDDLNIVADQVQEVKETINND